MDEYRLVACDFHDLLESLATLNQNCYIVFRNPSGKRVEVQTQIIDVYAANKADFLKLNDGTEIRLDRLISVNTQLVRFTNAEL
jgi:Rho-binding antiterminator